MTTTSTLPSKVVRFDIWSIPKKPPAPSVRRRPGKTRNGLRLTIKLR